MASTITTAATTAAAAAAMTESEGHLGGGGNQPLVPDQIMPLHPGKSSSAGQRRQILPRHNHHDEIMHDENGSSDDGDVEEKKDAHHNDPTPLHRNRRFFREQTPSGDELDEPSSHPQSDSQTIEPPNGEPSASDGNEQSDKNYMERKQQRASSKKRRIRKIAAVIEGDASTAFSPYRPVVPVSPHQSKNYNGISASDANNSIDGTRRNDTRKRGKRKKRRDKRDHRRDSKYIHIEKSGNTGRPKDEESERAGPSAASGAGNGFAQTNNAQHHASPAPNLNTNQQNPQTNADAAPADPIQSILNSSDDSILQNYLPQLEFLNENYYSRVKSYRMGRRDLPSNQIEVILRRRAVRKRTDVKNKVANVGAAGGGVVARGAVVAVGPSASASLPRRPPPHQATQRDAPARRKLFPTTQQQHSPTPSYRKTGHYEDDSTISSGTAASLPTAFPIQSAIEQPLPIVQAVAIPFSSQPLLPKEEIIGDTSLGLKLTILRGKVIVQRITALDDGRASPAQLCGALIEPGDVIIAVNGRSMVQGSVDKPVGMDRIISVLKPLSQPINDETKEYSREVRLRFALGEGRKLLQLQKEQVKRKAEDEEHRRKLGLDHKGGTTKDPAADLFGIGAFMGVDQHSGMPMFGHLAEAHHHDDGGEEEDERKKDASLEMDEEGAEATLRGKLGKKEASRKSIIDRTTARRSVAAIQAQIAHQVKLDRQFERKRNMSGFYTMNERAPKLLRPPSPPPQTDHSEGDLHTPNPMNSRQQRLERGLQTMAQAKSLVSVVERQDRGLDQIDDDEDPMEVASRACGTSTMASVRTGASRRRWHRGGEVAGGGGRSNIIVEEEDANDSVAAVSRASSIENRHPNFADVSTIRSGRSGRSGESGMDEMCDHRQLIELAANNDSWKRSVLKRLKAFNVEHVSEEDGIVPPPTATTGATSIDSLLFGGDVTSILNKKKQSLALPPGEMTAMLFDLVEQLSEGDGGVLPDQIFMNGKADESFLSAPPAFGTPEKVVSFSKNNVEMNVDLEKATDFLIDGDGNEGALGVWLKSFRPLPWKQRRALWPSSSSGLEGDYSTIMSYSRDYDNESLSMMSGTIATQRSTMDPVSAMKDKRNLREVIEDLELDHETRRETCRLVTFYFTQKFSNALSQTSSSSSTTTTLRTTKFETQPSREAAVADEEKEALASAFIDSYGSYLDIYKCLVFAGKCRSKQMVDGLVGVAKYDSQHKEAMKALQKAKVLLFYEPSMLSALLELLPSITTKQSSSNIDFIALLVSAYPDLKPWCVKEAVESCGNGGGFYMEYLSSLLHYEDGNDSAKRDEALVKEWCVMLCSPDGDAASDPTIAETYRQRFFRIASPENASSFLYHRDLPFLMDISVQISEFGLALSLANEIISNPRYCRDKHVLRYVLDHLCIISDKAIEGNEGEINTVLLAQIISFFNVISPCMQRHNCKFDIVAELSKLLEKCHIEIKNNPRYSPSNLDDCIATISEHASPAHSLQVLSQWEHEDTAAASRLSSSSLIFPALHTSLLRGAREGVRSELSGSLLRIQRAREEGRRPIVVNSIGMMNSWNPYAEEDPQPGGDVDDVGEEEASDGFLWPCVLDGTLGIAK